MHTGHTMHFLERRSSNATQDKFGHPTREKGCIIEPKQFWTKICICSGKKGCQVFSSFFLASATMRSKYKEQSSICGGNFHAATWRFRVSQPPVRLRTHVRKTSQKRKTRARISVETAQHHVINTGDWQVRYKMQLHRGMGLSLSTTMTMKTLTETAVWIRLAALLHSVWPMNKKVLLRPSGESQFSELKPKLKWHPQRHQSEGLKRQLNWVTTTTTSPALLR